MITINKIEDLKPYVFYTSAKENDGFSAINSFIFEDEKSNLENVTFNIDCDFCSMIFYENEEEINRALEEYSLTIEL